MSDDVEKRKELEQIIKRIAESEEQRLQNLKKEVDFYEEGLKKLKDIEAIKQAEILKSEAQVELQAKALEQIKKRVLQGQMLDQIHHDILKNLGIETSQHGNNLDVIEKQLEALERKKEAQNSINGLLKQQAPLPAKIQRSQAFIAEAAEQGRLAQVGAHKANIALEKGLMRFGGAIKDAILEMNKAQKSFERMTAGIFGPSVSKEVQNTVKDLDILGVSAEEAYGAQLQLSRIVTDFTTMTAGQQKQLRELAVTYVELGIN